MYKDFDPGEAGDHVKLAEIRSLFLRKGLANRIICDCTQGFKITHIKFDSEIVILNGPFSTQFALEALEGVSRVFR